LTTRSSPEAATDRFTDQLCLLATALSVVGIGGGAFLFTIVYKIDPALVLFVLNFIGLAVPIGIHFKGHFKKPGFKSFFWAWMCIHGLFAVALWRWFWMVYWLPFIALELIVAFAIAHEFFGKPAKNEKQ